MSDNAIQSNEANLAALLVCIGIFIVYYAYFYYKVMWSPDYAVQFRKNMRTMKQWARRHVLKQDAATAQQAVQALRNTIFVSTFVGGFAITFAFQLINSIDCRSFEGFATVLYMKDVRALIISILLFGSFFNWAMVLRYATEAGFMADSSSEASRLTNFGNALDETEVRIAKLGVIAVRMAAHFTFAFRFMFVSIPFAFISVSWIALVIATVFILYFHYDYDFMNHSTLLRDPAARSSLLPRVAGEYPSAAMNL